MSDITENDARIFDLYIKTRYGERILDNAGLMVTNNIEDLSEMIYLLYGTSWDRLYTSYTAEYNPIWNVDGTETTTETRDLEQTHKGTDNYKHSGADTLAHSGTDTYAKTGSDTEDHTGSDTNAKSGSDTTDSNVTRDHQVQQHNINGFNSATAQPADTDTTDHDSSGNEKTTYDSSVKETRNLQDKTTYDSQEKNTKDLTDKTTYDSSNDNTKDMTDTDTGKVITEHKRGGNIGVTMTQQMLEADLAYWRKLEARFYDNVCKDIVDFITYNVYTDTDETNAGTDGTTVSIEKYVKDIIPAQIDGVKIATVIIEDNKNG